MEFFTFLCIVCVIYAMLGFFDFFFNSCMMLPYINFMKSAGIKIRLMRIQWHTTAFNRVIVKWSHRLPSFYKKSFKLGVYLSVLLLPVALVLLLISVFTSNQSGSSTEQGGGAGGTADLVHLEILLPGVNLPINQFGYYITSLLICSIVHELGHGLVAVFEDIPVLGFGLHLIFIIPIAYTEIDHDQLSASKVWKKLAVYSAGIWNNLILAAFAYGFLLLIPLMFAPIYDINNSVIVTKVKPRSILYGGENGLRTGEIITEINGCRVRNEDDWIKCLKETIVFQPAYCVNDDFVQKNDESIQVTHEKDGQVNCCSANNALNCFENVLSRYDDAQFLPQYTCLNIRNAIENAVGYCQKGEKKCEMDSSCLKPILGNHSTIIQMKRVNNKKDLIYYGSPADVVRNVEISDFVPKTKFIRTSHLGDILTMLLKYLCIFSSGLAIVNVIPCYGLDGQFLINALISNLDSKKIPKTKKDSIIVVINILGSVLLLIAVIKILWSTMFVNVF